MKLFNVTAQVYETLDKDKQTLLINKEVHATDSDHATSKFTHYLLHPHYQILKIYSVEEIFQDRA